MCLYLTSFLFDIQLTEEHAGREKLVTQLQTSLDDLQRQHARSAEEMARAHVEDMTQQRKDAARALAQKETELDMAHVRASLFLFFFYLSIILSFSLSIFLFLFVLFLFLASGFYGLSQEQLSLLKNTVSELKERSAAAQADYNTREKNHQVCFSLSLSLPLSLSLSLYTYIYIYSAQRLISFHFSLCFASSSCKKSARQCSSSSLNYMHARYVQSYLPTKASTNI